MTTTRMTETERAEALRLAEYDISHPCDCQMVICEDMQRLSRLVMELVAEKARLELEASAMLTAVQFHSPPRDFNGALCWEARVPVEFVVRLKAALQHEGSGE